MTDIMNAEPPSGFGLDMPPQVAQTLQKIQKAIELLREDHVGYRIDVEVDTMVAGDQQQERQDAVQFIEAITQFVGEAGKIIQVNPQFATLAGPLLQFGVRKFRSGRDLEAKVDEFVENIEKEAKNPQPKGPSPEQMKAQAAQITAQSKLQQVQVQAKADQITSQAEIQRQQVENQGEMQNSQADMLDKQADVKMKQMEMQIELTRLQIEKIKAEAALKAAHIGAQTDMMNAIKPQAPQK